MILKTLESVFRVGYCLFMATIARNAMIMTTITISGTYAQTVRVVESHVVVFVANHAPKAIGIRIAATRTPIATSETFSIMAWSLSLGSLFFENREISPVRK